MKVAILVRLCRPLPPTPTCKKEELSTPFGIDSMPGLIVYQAAQNLDLVCQAE